MTNTTSPFSTAEIMAIAKNHKMVIYIFLGQLIFNPLLIFADRFFVILIFLVEILSVIVLIMALYQLAKVLKKPILWRIGLFIPGANFIVLLFLFPAASKALKLGGLRVGALGVASSDLKRLTTEEQIATKATSSSVL